MKPVRLMKSLAAPLMLSASFSTSAALVTHNFDNGDSLAGWQVDRAAPAGFGISNNELVMRIDGNTVDNAFYNTQGMKLDIGQSTFLSIDMYIDSAWASSERFGGLWGVGYDSTDAISAYPILEFWNTVGGTTGVSYWDNAWAGTSSLYTLDSFNNLALQVTATGVDYFLNGNLIYSDTQSGTTYLGDVILNAKSEGTPFNVRYDNLTYGTVPEPGVVALLGIGGLLLLARRRRL